MSECTCEMSARLMGIRPCPVHSVVSEIDRSEVNRSLAKAIAFKAVGKHEESARWARRLVEQLDSAGILIPEEAK